MYISTKIKFAFVVLIAILWTIISLIIDYSWFLTVASVLGYPLALCVLLGLAILPGVMICFFSLGGLLFDRPQRHDLAKNELEDVTILIAAYNEEDTIYDTLKSINQQQFLKNIYVKVIDNNSSDNTKGEIIRAKRELRNIDIEYMFAAKPGKQNALNEGLRAVKTKYFITIDADTYLYNDAISIIVNHIIQENKNKTVGAVAGTILVRNSRQNLLTKLQEWEYFLSIATIKRSQGLFQTTMVAQGAFSIYRTDLVREVGGYSDCITEDIALTYSLLSLGETKVQYSDIAIAFTNAPDKMKRYFTQRKRWARGGIESRKYFNRRTCKNFYTKFFMFVNSMNIVGEFGITFFMIPGIILALVFHNFLLIGWWTGILYLVTLFIYLMMIYKQWRHVFRESDLKIRKHWISFVVYIIAYPILLAPICICGYAQQVFHTKKKW